MTMNLRNPEVEFSASGWPAVLIMAYLAMCIVDNILWMIARYL